MLRRISYFFIVISVITIECRGQDRRDVRALLPHEWKWSTDVQGPMCGIYSVCRSLSILGFDVQLNDLWSPKYVGSPHGSSPSELIEAVKKFGGLATMHHCMSYTELITAGLPVVANVRKDPFSKQFDHWVCVVNSSDGLRVFDGPDASRIVEPSEFLAIWNGVGIVVAKNRFSLAVVNVTRFVSIAILVVIAYLILMHSRWMSSASKQIGWVPIAVATIVCAVIGNWLYGTGISHFDAVQLAIAHTIRRASAK